MNAATITRQSKSNLALAFVSLGRERKRDITIFYAFCRVVDDIADSTELSVIEKRVRQLQHRLLAWQQIHTQTIGKWREDVFSCFSRLHPSDDCPFVCRTTTAQEFDKKRLRVRPLGVSIVTSQFGLSLLDCCALDL